jgi:hypothetical protein
VARRPKPTSIPPEPLAVGQQVGDVTVVQVAQGRLHGAAVLADGTVRCWGDATGCKCRVPKLLGRTVAVAVSDDHTVALQADGRVRSWGWQSLGQSTLLRRVGRAVEIAAGGAQYRCWTAALLEDGRIRIWGYGACPDSPWPVPEEHRRDFVEWCVPHLERRAAMGWLRRELAQSVRDWSSTRRNWAAVLADGRTIHDARRGVASSLIPEGLGPIQGIAIAEGLGAAITEHGSLTCWCDPWRSPIDTPEEGACFTKVSSGRYFIAALGADRRISIIAGRDSGWSRSLRVPDELQGRVVDIRAASQGIFAVDDSGRLHAWGRVDDINFLPFELTDDSWLEFATRMWGKTKEKIYPRHIRKSAVFKAIRTMHKLAEG